METDMLKIALCDVDVERSVLLFNEMRAILDKTSVKCELTRINDFSVLKQKLSKNTSCFDILVLDSQDEQSVKICAALRRKNLIASIVFLVPEAFDVKLLARFRPTAYITDISELRQVYDALKYTCNEQARKTSYITVKNRGELIRVNFSDILYFESRLRIVMLYTKTQVIEFYAKLSDIIQLLPSDTFVKCHQSYVVNLEEVSLLDKKRRVFIFPGGREIEISKSNYSAVSEKYSNFLQG